MKKRKSKPKWLHYAQLRKPGVTWTGTWCNKTAERIPKTSDPNKVTCPRCLKEMKKAMYFCPEHGFVDGEDVTFNETCDYCGRSVL